MPASKHVRSELWQGTHRALWRLRTSAIGCPHIRGCDAAPLGTLNVRNGPSHHRQEGREIRPSLRARNHLGPSKEADTQMAGISEFELYHSNSALSPKFRIPHDTATAFKHFKADPRFNSVGVILTAASRLLPQVKNSYLIGSTCHCGFANNRNWGVFTIASRNRYQR